MDLCVHLNVCAIVSDSIVWGTMHHCLGFVLDLKTCKRLKTSDVRKKCTWALLYIQAYSKIFSQTCMLCYDLYMLEFNGKFTMYIDVSENIPFSDIGNTKTTRTLYTLFVIIRQINYS